MALAEPLLRDAPVDDVFAAAVGPRHPWRAALVALIGVAAIVVAMYGIRSADTTLRCAVAAVGIGALFNGLQRLGRMRFGGEFALGLWLALAFLILVLFCAIFADLLPIDSYRKTEIVFRRARPRLSFDEPLGRDANGASLLSRVIFSARVSLLVAVLSVSIGLFVGSLLGLVGGFFGGWVDTVLNVITNATLAFPPLILLFAIVAVFSRSIWTLGIGLAIVSVPTYARVMRAQTISVRQREFVLASRSMGANGRRIMFREILPNALLPVASYSFIVAAAVVVAEGSLAFLGLGIPPPRPSWGSMVADGEIKLKTDPHLVFVPAAVMFLTVLSFNRIGDWARKRVMGERNLM